MDDLISRNEAREIIADMRGLCRNDVLCDAMAKINALPSVSAVQEPVKPTLDIRHGKSMWRCGSCSTALQPNQMNAKFCFNCGKAVKWE